MCIDWLVKVFNVAAAAATVATENVRIINRFVGERSVKVWCSSVDLIGNEFSKFNLR